MSNNLQACINLLTELNFEDVSGKGCEWLPLDLNFKNKFKKGFISLGIDHEKILFGPVGGLMVDATFKNITKINQLNSILEDLLGDETCQEWLGKSKN